MTRLILTLVTTLCVVSSIWAVEDAPSWSWNNDNEDKVLNKRETINDNIATDTNAYADQYQNNNSSLENDIDEIVNNILLSNRQGRNLDGFDEVYSDPTVQDAIQNGDDSHARNLIKDKLCSLGLMQCDDVEGKRPYYGPQDLIYAQPIAIKPVGRPIPSVPIRGNGPPPQNIRGPYGAPRPIPMPSGNNYGPPRKVGYGGPPPSSGPIYSSKPTYFSGPPSGPPGAYLSSPPSSGSYSGPPISGGRPPFSSKPLGPVYDKFEGDIPYEFENAGQKLYIDNEKPNFIKASESTIPQQHVHHHFHHVDSTTDTKTVVVNSPVPIPPHSVAVPVGSGNSISSGFSASSSSNYQGLNTNGFIPATTGFDYSQLKGSSSNFNSANSLNAGNSYASGVKPVFEESSSQNFGSAYLQSQYQNAKQPFSSGSNQGPATFGGSNEFSGSNFNGNSDSFGLGSQNSGSYASNNAVYQGGPTNFNSDGPSNYNGNGQSNYNSNGQSTFNSQSSFNGNAGDSFHSSNPDFYKKELNVNAPIRNNNNGLSSFGSQSQSQYNKYTQQNNQFGGGETYQGFESGRQDVFDCVCVPYSQCPSQDIIGRKDDLFLNVDPRTLGTEIEALSDDNTAVVTDGNGTMTVIRVAKEAAKVNETIALDATTTEKSEVKKVSKRDVAEAEKKQDDEKANIEPVRFQLHMLFLTHF